MKQPSKNEIDMLNLINKIQAQLVVLDKKVDVLIHRSLPETKLTQKTPLNPTPLPIRRDDRNKGRMMHTAVCADCKKECMIPFKPSGDRPVYCQDCFSRRKVIHLSGIKIDDKPKEVVSPQKPVIKAIDVPFPSRKTKKKAITTKKSIKTKKPVPKKK